MPKTKPGFDEIYRLLERKGPGRAESSKGYRYKLEAKTGEKNKRRFILGTTQNGGKVRIHDDWNNDCENHGTRIGGICRGPYSIYDWYNENK
jgi:hypothetical protein